MSKAFWSDLTTLWGLKAISFSQAKAPESLLADASSPLKESVAVKLNRLPRDQLLRQ